MITGQLTSFPITTVLELASSARTGICPTMQSIVRPVSLASLDVTASEHAIRLALDDIIGNGITYSNILGGVPVFESLSSWTPELSTYYANFNTLSAGGQYLTGYMSGHTMLLSGWYNDDIYNFYPAGSVKMPVQGGRYQYSRTFDENDFIYMHANNGLNIGFASANDLIGKIFIKSYGTDFSATNNAEVSFSVGTDADDERYVRKFHAPVLNGLVDFQYNVVTLSGGFVWLKADEVIKMYCHYTTLSDPFDSGMRLGVSVFYDQAEFTQSDGYFLRSSVLEDIYRFSFSDNTFSNRKRNPSYTAYEKTMLCVKDVDGRLFSAGGRTDAGSNYANVEMFNPSTDTNAGLISVLSEARFGMGTFSDVSRMFFAGGSTVMTTSAFISEGVQSIECYDASNGTMNSAVQPLLCNRYLPAAITESTGTYGYVMGGMANGTPLIEQIKQDAEKYNFASDTVESPVFQLPNKKYAVNPFKFKSYVYVGAGYSVAAGYPSSTMYIENFMLKFDTSNDTGQALVNNSLVMKCALAQSVQDNVDAYTCFGIGMNHSNTYSAMSDNVLGKVEKMSFANETNMVIESNTSENLGISPAGSI
jgi:hypothetical protein